MDRSQYLSVAEVHWLTLDEYLLFEQLNAKSEKFKILKFLEDKNNKNKVTLFITFQNKHFVSDLINIRKSVKLRHVFNL